MVLVFCLFMINEVTSKMIDLFSFFFDDRKYSYNHDQDIALRCGFASADGHPGAVCPQRSGKCPNGKW